MKTCVSLECPFIWYCNQYNYLIDRGDHCDHQDQILRQAKKLEKIRRAQKKAKRKEAEDGTREKSKTEVPGE